MDPAKCIRVRGAREHNLKNLDVAIPRDAMVVLTGVSGSGKSSLAFDTIFAEGQRKYMESLSAYARQFLDQMQKPDVEAIEGLPPTIAIEQRGSGHTPRSTVATTTEIYDYLRLLFARCGTPTCWHTDERGHVCGKPISAATPTQIVDALLAAEGRRLMVCAPVVRSKKGFHKEVLEALARQGTLRVRVNGQLLDLREALKPGGENPLGLGRYEQHDIEAVVDRIVARAEDKQRLAESVESALKMGQGSLVVLERKADGTWEESRYSEVQLPGPSGAARWRSWSRACSASTARMAPAPCALAWGRCARLTQSWWCQTPPSLWARAPSSRGRATARA